MGTKAGGGGEVTGVGVGGQVARGDEELGAEDGADSGHRLDDGCLRVGVEGVADLPVELLEPFVQGQHLRGEVCGDARGRVLAGQLDVLGVRGGEAGGGDRFGVAHASCGEPAA